VACARGLVVDRLASEISPQSTYLGIRPADIALRPICPLGASGLAVRRHNEIIESQLRRRACLGGLDLSCVGFLATETDDRRLFARSVPLLTVALFLSLLPVFPAPDIQIVADQYFMLLIVLGSWIVLALYVGMGPCIRLRGARRALTAAADPPAAAGQFALIRANLP
jgi:hypothetical protein